MQKASLILALGFLVGCSSSLAPRSGGGDAGGGHAAGGAAGHVFGGDTGGAAASGGNAGDVGGSGGHPDGGRSGGNPGYGGNPGDGGNPGGGGASGGHAGAGGGHAGSGGIGGHAGGGGADHADASSDAQGCAASVAFGCFMCDTDDSYTPAVCMRGAWVCPGGFTREGTCAPCSMILPVGCTCSLPSGLITCFHDASADKPRG